MMNGWHVQTVHIFALISHCWIIITFFSIPAAPISICRTRAWHFPSRILTYPDAAVLYRTIYTQIARFMGQTWGPSGSCRSQLGPMLDPWTLLSGLIVSVHWTWQAIIVYRVNNSPHGCYLNSTWSWAWKICQLCIRYGPCQMAG